MVGKLDKLAGTYPNSLVKVRRRPNVNFDGKNHANSPKNAPEDDGKWRISSYLKPQSFGNYKPNKKTVSNNESQSNNASIKSRISQETSQSEEYKNQDLLKVRQYLSSEQAEYFLSSRRKDNIDYKQIFSEQKGLISSQYILWKNTHMQKYQNSIGNSESEIFNSKSRYPTFADSP
jgi:hypothetical protein